LLRVFGFEKEVKDDKEEEGGVVAPPHASYD
jgi:hypothetical protein